VRAKEGQLISVQEWQRLADAPDLTNWLEQLKTTGYGPFIANAQNFEDFEEGLNNYFAELKNDLCAIDHFPCGKMLWKKYDYHNFKIFLKMKLGHKDLKKYLLPFGEIPLKTLELYLLESEKVDLSLYWLKLLRQAEEVYQRTGSFAELNNFLDRTYYQELSALLSGWSQKVQTYFRRTIDAANFREWWYLRKGQTSKIEYFDGGTVPVKTWNILDTLAAVGRRVFPGVELGENEGEAVLQKKIDDFISWSLFRERFRNESVLPILVFFRAKENEIKNLKIYYLKKAKQMETLSSYLRESYV
jgi:vacuolar-type H+-ATPase subunit C/Vma6